MHLLESTNCPNNFSNNFSNNFPLQKKILLTGHFLIDLNRKFLLEIRIQLLFLYIKEQL